MISSLTNKLDVSMEEINQTRAGTVQMSQEIQEIVSR